MSGDGERWRRESEAWKKWEGWVPGDPIPGEIPGLARSDQPTTRHPPTGRRRRPTVVPPPPPPGAHQRRSPSPAQHHVPPPPSGRGVTVARSAVELASARATRARGRAGQSPASAARGCLVGVVVMFVVFGGLVPACLAAVADRISDEGSSGGLVVTEATIGPAELDEVGRSPAAAIDVLRDHLGADIRLVSSIEATSGSVAVDVVPSGRLGAPRPPARSAVEPSS